MRRKVRVMDHYRMRAGGDIKCAQRRADAPLLAVDEDLAPGGDRELEAPGVGPRLLRALFGEPPFDPGDDLLFRAGRKPLGRCRRWGRVRVRPRAVLPRLSDS